MLQVGVCNHFSVSQVGVCTLRSAKKKNTSRNPAAADCILLIVSIFPFVPEKVNSDEGAGFVAVPPAWSIYMEELLREFALEKLPFDCEMAKLCEACFFQHLVIRWLYSLCVIVASPLWSKVESGCNSISEHGAHSQEEAAAQSEHKEKKKCVFNLPEVNEVRKSAVTSRWLSYKFNISLFFPETSKTHIQFDQNVTFWYFFITTQKLPKSLKSIIFYGN